MIVLADGGEKDEALVLVLLLLLDEPLSESFKSAEVSFFSDPRASFKESLATVPSSDENEDGVSSQEEDTPEVAVELKSAAKLRIKKANLL